MGLGNPSTGADRNLHRARGSDQAVPAVLPRSAAGVLLRERKIGAWAKSFAAAIAAWLAVDLPIYLWSPDAFKWFWEFNSSRGPDFGSLWLVRQRLSRMPRPRTRSTSSPGCSSARLPRRSPGLDCWRRGVRGCLSWCSWSLLAFLIVNKVYSPQYVLWLLPLAALARPRWRDLLIWQACEALYFFAVWMHLAGSSSTEGTTTGCTSPRS